MISIVLASRCFASVPAGGVDGGSLLLRVLSSKRATSLSLSLSAPPLVDALRLAAPPASLVAASLSANCCCACLVSARIDSHLLTPRGCANVARCAAATRLAALISASRRCCSDTASGAGAASSAAAGVAGTPQGTSSVATMPLRRSTSSAPWHHSHEATPKPRCLAGRISGLPSSWTPFLCARRARCSCCVALSGSARWTRGSVATPMRRSGKAGLPSSVAAFVRLARTTPTALGSRSTSMSSRLCAAAETLSSSVGVAPSRSASS